MPKNTGRKQDGTFMPGTSGNPAGRPKGARNQATIIAQALIDEQAAALSQKAIDLALSGDPLALRLCLERLVPKRTDRLIHFTLPKIGNSRDALTALDHITQASTNGEISLTEAKALSEIIQNYVKCYEVACLEERLEYVEKSIGVVGN